MTGPQQRLGPAYRFVAAVVRPLSWLLTRREWKGTEYIPPVGTGVLVVSNHVSHADFATFGLFIWANGRAPRYLAKASLFSVPVLGAILRSCGQIPVHRESRDASMAYRDAVAAIGAGECVAIYPEGTISRDPGLWPMVGKTGAARVALATGCDIVPVAQWGAQEILPPYAKLPRVAPRTLVRVTAGPPLDLSDLRGQPVTPELLRDATDRIMDAVTGLLEGIRGEAAPAVRFDPRTSELPRTGDPSRPDEEPSRPDTGPTDGSAR